MENLGLFESMKKYDTSSLPQRIEWETVTPVSPIQDSSATGGAFIFKIPGREMKLVDLNRTQLFIRLRVFADWTEVKAGKAAGLIHSVLPKTTATPDIALVNLPLHSIFSRAEMRFGNELVSRADRRYSYKAYLETLLFEAEMVKKTRLRMEGFFSDSAQSPNNYGRLAMPGGNMFNSNYGFDMRSRMIAKSQTVDLLGDLHFDICQQPKPIVNNLDIYITLHPADGNFSLIGDGDRYSNPRIQFEQLQLKVCRIELSRPAINMLEHQLLHGGAFYQYHRTEFATVRLAAGARSFDKTTLFTERSLPHHIYVCFVSEDAFLGKFTANPFYFENFKCSNLAVYVENQMLNGSYLNLNPENKTRPMCDAYNSLFSSLGVDGNDIGISFEQFVNGNTIVCYQILNSFDPTATVAHGEGSIKIEGKFDEALPNNAICLVMAKYSAELCIDQNRHVSFA